MDLEKERNFALVDKVKISDINKLLKQRLYLPPSVMVMVWMTQNFLSFISLCFGPNSILAKFLKDWVEHMYENHLIYLSLQASDPSLYAKVLFSIDNTLQLHWRSCSINEDGLSVNNRVLLMPDTQDSILRHNFIQKIPKSLNDKVLVCYEKDSKQSRAGKHQGKQGGSGKDQRDLNKADIITDNDTNHAHWHVITGEDFAKTFYRNQHTCPKSRNGKIICI